MTNKTRPTAFCKYGGMSKMRKALCHPKIFRYWLFKVLEDMEQCSTRHFQAC